MRSLDRMSCQTDFSKFDNIESYDEYDEHHYMLTVRQMKRMA